LAYDAPIRASSDRGIRRLSKSGAILVGALALLACGSPSSSASPASGIKGRAVLWPTCPVQRAGQSCERGYRTTLKVLTATRHRLVTKVRSGRDGHFQVRVAPGRYTLKSTSRGLPRSTPMTVTVRRHRFTIVKFVFDTGIR
jgi:hypothetical protein